MFGSVFASIIISSMRVNLHRIVSIDLRKNRREDENHTSEKGGKKKREVKIVLFMLYLDLYLNMITIVI